MSGEGLLKGLFGAAPLCVGLIAGGGGQPCIAREDLSRVIITGDCVRRDAVMREAVLRVAGAGDLPLTIDFTGVFRPLARFIPQLRVHRIGSRSALSPFSGGDQASAKVAALSVQEFYGLSRDERIYLEKALEAAHAGGDACPGFRSIRDRLLEAEAEAHPREGSKIEALRHVLWELETGAVGLAIKSGAGKAMRAPASVDLSEIPEPRGRGLMGATALLRAVGWGATAIAVDRADWLIPRGASREFGFAMEESLLKAGAGGAVVLLGAPSARALPEWLTEGATARIECGGIWEQPAGARRSVQGDRQGHISALAQVRRLPQQVLLEFRETGFQEMGGGDLDAHMEALGEESGPLKAPASGTTILEGIFAERRALIYATEVLTLVKGGRIPVDAVARRSGAALRRIVRALQKRFLIVEQADAAGAYWYRLTKAGEKALAEIEERGASKDESETDV